MVASFGCGFFMSRIEFTLVSEGSSDKALLPLLRWMLEQYCRDCTIRGTWADLGYLPRPPRTLDQKIEMAIDLYPCSLLFVHRDADGQTRDDRVEEIMGAAEAVTQRIPEMPAIVCAVPVRMLEAWLLFDEQAIRSGAENPKGGQPVGLPAFQEMEQIPNPKQRLYETLKRASGYSGRKLKKFNERAAVHRVAERIDDFSPLRRLPAFQAMEQDLQQKLPLLLDRA